MVTEHPSSVSERLDLSVEGSFDIGDTTVASETSICEKMESLAIYSDEKSLYCPDNSSTSASEDSVSLSCNAAVDLTIRRNALNEFLTVSGINCIPVSRKPFSQLTKRSQNTHVSIATESIIALLDVIAPGDGGALWEATKRAKLVEKNLTLDDLDDTDKVYLKALAETYQHAVGWDTRRQVLSVMADLVPFSKIQKYLPDITHYRVKAARHHKLEYGRGAPVPDSRSSRMRVSTVQLDHFLTFITSPHVVQDLPFGQRHIHLSNGKIIETPNVIRTMIKQRIITQYSQFCTETNFKPFSPSTMHRILSSCSASVRKSLQGLDYIAAEGTTAFDDLLSVSEKLFDHGLDHHTVQRLQLALKEGKQYLKTDYKVKLIHSFIHSFYIISLFFFIRFLNY